MNAMQAMIERAWLARGWLAWLLRPLSLLYGFIVARRGPAALRVGAQRAPQVLVVGNVVAGGAGKTPVVLAIVEHLKARGMKVGVVSRGWGRDEETLGEVSQDSLAAEVGDEPLLIAQRTGVPVWVGRQRQRAVDALVAQHPDVQIIVSDDGLQHRALARDLEVCVLDARGIGNGWLLPAGPLREPWPRHADFYLDGGGQATEALRGLHPAFAISRTLAAQATNAAGSRLALAALTGRRVAALAGIAQPDRFFDMLESVGVPLAMRIACPDHASFEAGLPAEARGAEVVLCTEKDAVKLWASHPEVFAVALELRIDPGFWAAFDARLLPLPNASLSSTDGHQTA